MVADPANVGEAATGFVGRWSGHARRVSSRAARRVHRWWKGKPYLLAIALAVGLYAFKELLGPALTAAATRLGTNKDVLLAILLAICFLTAAVSLLIGLLRPGRPVEPLPSWSDGGDLEVHRNFTRQGVTRVQEDVIKPIFHDAYPVEDEIYAMYARNPGMGVGLYSLDERQYVAFACAWPLTARAAKALLAGTITENDLTARDVLPTARNRQATHLLVPVIAVLHAHTPLGARRGLKLTSEFRRMLKETYWDGDDRPVTFVATGFSPEGRRICAMLKMEALAAAKMGSDEFPVFARTLTRSELRMPG